MKLRKLSLLMLAASLALTACGQNGGTESAAPADASAAESSADAAASGEDAGKEPGAADAPDASAADAHGVPEAASDAAGSSSASASSAEVSADAAETPATVWDGMNGTIFGFMSGVGAWETTLKVAPDGSISGMFNDMNMGETGEGYDNGTLYESAFTGRFSEPEKIDDLTWKTKVQELSYDTQKDGSDRYIDDEKVLHILTDPYGLSAGDDIIIYLAGTPLNILSEEFMSWMGWRLEGAKVLPETAIFNETSGCVFYPDHYAMGDADTFEAGAYDDSTDADGSEIYSLVKNAYQNQSMPDYYMLPYVPAEGPAPASPYQSVTLSNLQGRWVNSYKEGGANYIEVLTVNGDRGRIECYRDGVPTNAWNDVGTVSIEDRSDRGVCPAFRITGEDGSNVCTIYIRWVRDDAFFDGGFLNEWKLEAPANPEDLYLYDTVTMDNLQGVWYTEYMSGESLAQVILHVDGNRASLFETLDYVPFDVWNGEGAASLDLTETSQWDNVYRPMLRISFDDGPSAGGTAGIYISEVQEDRFYDCGLDLWYMKVPEDYEPYVGEEEGNHLSYTPLEDGGLKIDGTYSYELRPEGEVTEVGTALDWKIVVTDAEGRTQTIRHSVDEATIYIPDEYGVLFEDDVNFDGVMDLVLYKGTFGAQGVSYYVAYLADDGRFVNCGGFDEIPDPYPDPESGLVYGHIRDSAASYYELSYRIQNRTAVPVSMNRFVYSEEAGDYVPE